MSVDAILASVEAFILEEGIRCGVIRQVVPRLPKNPNKLRKHLAPWFKEECRAARSAYYTVRGTSGIDSPTSRAAYSHYRQTCSRQRNLFLSTLPFKLKYHPKWFWHVVLQREYVSCPIPPATMADHM